MEITKDSIVTSICGIKSNIKLFELCEYMSKIRKQFMLEKIQHTSYPYKIYLEDINDIVQSLRNDQFIDGDDIFEMGYDENGIWYNDRDTCDGTITLVLEKFFGEEYLKMIISETTCHIISETKSEGLTYLEHSIEDKYGNVLSVVTKDYYKEGIIKVHDYLLNEDEENKWNEYREKFDCYGDQNDFYFIKKSDFDKDKWWLGWTKQE